MQQNETGEIYKISNAKAFKHHMFTLILFKGNLATELADTVFDHHKSTTEFKVASSNLKRIKMKI